MVAPFPDLETMVPRHYHSEPISGAEPPLEKSSVRLRRWTTSTRVVPKDSLFCASDGQKFPHLVNVWQFIWHVSCAHWGVPWHMCATHNRHISCVLRKEFVALLGSHRRVGTFWDSGCCSVIVSWICAGFSHKSTWVCSYTLSKEQTSSSVKNLVGEHVKHGDPCSRCTETMRCHTHKCRCGSTISAKERVKSRISQEPVVQRPGQTKVSRLQQPSTSTGGKQCANWLRRWRHQNPPCTESWRMTWTCPKSLPSLCLTFWWKTSIGIASPWVSRTCQVSEMSPISWTKWSQEMRVGCRSLSRKQKWNPVSGWREARHACAPSKHCTLQVRTRSWWSFFMIHTEYWCATLCHMVRLWTVTTTWQCWKSWKIASDTNNQACGQVVPMDKPTETSSFITTMPLPMCLPRLWDSSRTSGSFPTRSTPRIWCPATSFCSLIWSLNSVGDDFQPLILWRWRSGESSKWWRTQRLHCSTIPSGVWHFAGRNVLQQKDIILKAGRSRSTPFLRQKYWENQQLNPLLRVTATIKQDACRTGVVHVSISCSWLVQIRMNTCSICAHICLLSCAKNWQQMRKLSVSKLHF